MNRIELASLSIWMAAACVLFAIAPPPPGPPPPTEQELAAMQRATDFVVRDTRRWQAEHGDLTLPWSEARGHLAIVIDDVGRELHVFEMLTSLRFRLTFAVLPGAIYAAGVQLRLRADRRRAREILLHLPMEPLEPASMQAGAEAREEFLRVTDDPEHLRSKLAHALERVPAAIGVNNHMGSRLTGSRMAMDVLMPELATRGLLFLDSRTTADSVAELAAREAGVTTGARHVFLDHVLETGAIEQALEQAAATSLEHPTIAIGHPSAELHAVLERRLPELHARGIGIYPLSHVLTQAAR